MTELLLMNLYTPLSLNQNGLHIFEFAFYHGKLIPFNSNLFNTNANQIYFVKHMGIKHYVTDEVSIVALFTSQENTFFHPNIVMKNINLENSIHKNINLAFFMINQDISNYYRIHDNLNLSPDYIKSSINHKNIDFLVYDSIEAYKKSIFSINLNNPFILIDNMYYNLLTSSKPSKIDKFNYLKCIRTFETLRFLNVSPYNVENFIKALSENKTIRGESLYKNNLKF